MARLNIEDSLINDERFIFVCNKIGRYQAMGQFVFLAKLAQRYWLEKKLIPESVYSLGEFSDVFLTSGLVEKKEDGFYLKGSEEHFAWIISKKENGVKSGEARKNKALGRTKSNDTRTNLNDGEPLTLSLSPAPTQIHNTLVPPAQKEEAASDASQEDKATFLVIVDAWNEMAPQVDLPTFKAGTKLYEKVARNAKTALKDYPDKESWYRIVEGVPLDGFRLGRNEKGWKASLPWLFQKSPSKKIENYVLMMDEWDKAYGEAA